MQLIWKMERKNGLSDGILDRLMLNADRIKGMAKGVEDIVKLPDPVGKILNTTVRPNGLKNRKGFSSFRSNSCNI